MKLGQTISAQDFSKYAPRGLQVKSSIHPVTIYYDLKLFNDLGDYSHPCRIHTEEAIGSFIPGFIFHNTDLGIIQHLGVAWSGFETNDYVILKLPTKIIKKDITMSFKPGTKVRIRHDIASIQQNGYSQGFFITDSIHRMAGEVVTIRREADYKGAYYIEENSLGFVETWLQPITLLKRRKQC